MAEDGAANSTKPEIEFRRDEEFASLYANHVRYETSVWNLRLVFGELDLTVFDKEVVNQHTAITLPWLQVRLMIYFLQVNLAVHEARHGKVILPSAVAHIVPPLPNELLGDLANDPAAISVLDKLRELRQQLLENA